MGKAEFYPFFDDLNHLIKFTPSGIHEINRDGNRWVDYQFTFPGDVIAEYLSIALIRGYYRRSGKDKLFRIAINPDRIYAEKCKFAPRIKWNFGDPYNRELNDVDTGKVKRKLVTDLNNPVQSRLRDCINGLVRIGKNYSDGMPSIINLSFDSYSNEDESLPSSYFFSITNNDRSIIHGGIIAHKHEDKFEYSTHT